MPPTAVTDVLAAEPGRATVVSTAATVLASALAPSAASLGPAAPVPPLLVAYNDTTMPAGGAVTLTVGAEPLLLEEYLPQIMAAFAVAEYILMVLMLVCNVFVVAAYACSRFSGRKSSSSRLSAAGRLVLNLTVADIMVALGLVYFSMPKFWPETATILAKYYVPCVLRFAVCQFTMFGSHCALLVVAVDRYVAIVHTLHYKDFMTTKMSWAFVAAGWLPPLAGATAIFFTNAWHEGVPSCDEYHIVPQFLMVFAMPANVFILATISLAHWSVHREVKAFTERCNDPMFVASSATQRRSHTCHKSAKVLLRVTGTFILCWTPLDVMLVAFVVFGPQPVLLVVFEAAFVLAITSYLLNPLVYAWKTEAIHRPLVAALVTLRLLPARSLDPRAAGGPAGALKRTGVFAITRNTASITSVSHTSSSSGSATGSTAQSWASAASHPEGEAGPAAVATAQHV